MSLIYSGTVVTLRIETQPGNAISSTHSIPKQSHTDIL